MTHGIPTGAQRHTEKVFVFFSEIQIQLGVLSFYLVGLASQRWCFLYVELPQTLLGLNPSAHPGRKGPNSQLQP